MKSKSEVAKYFKKCLSQSKATLSSQYENTTKAIQFYNGDTMAYRDTIQFQADSGKKRATVQFNKVQPNVDAVVGFMAQNRRHAKYIARLNANPLQNLYSKYMNALYEYTRENTNADQLETDQDADMMINGYGAIETDLSYIVGNATTDPNGKVIKCRLDPARVGWESSARAKNLLDSSFVYYWDEYPLKQALDLFDKSTEEDFEPAGQDDESGQYRYNPYGGLYDQIKADNSVDWVSESEERVRVYNFQWFEYETFYRADNPLFFVDSPELAQFMQMRLMALAPQLENEVNGVDGAESTDPFVFDPAQEIWTLNQNQYRILKKELGEYLDAAPLKRKVYYTAVISGSHVFSLFRSISQAGFSVKFKTGTFDAHRKIWVGMVNAMMEPAEYHNKALTELMFTIAANSKGGVLVEEDAVEDITEFESKWAKTDAVIVVNSGAIAAGKIQEKTRAAMPTGLEGIITLTAAAITENGVDPSFVGNLREEGQSGILYKRRIRQVISKMARYFDSITLYQKEDARLCADLIRVWAQNNNGEFVRITGEDGADEFVRISEDNLAPEYDISIQEAAQTPEDKQETAVMLKGMGSELMAMGNQAGISFIVESLNYIPIDGDVRNRLAEALQPQQMIPIEQYQQLEQQLQAMQSELAQLQAMKVQSEIEKNQADAAKRLAETQTEEMEAIKVREQTRNQALENEMIVNQTYNKAQVFI